MMLRSNFTHQFGTSMLPVLEKLILDEYDKAMDLVPEILNMRAMDRDIIQSATVSGLPAAPENSEGSALQYEDLKQGYSKTYTALKYRLGIKITNEMIKDGRYIDMAENARALGDAMFETRQVVGFGVLNNGFSSSFNGPDGVPLFSASHPLLGGLTDDNTDAADISISALRTALQDMRDTRNLQNLRRPYRARKLVVTITDQWLAAEIINSPLKSGGSTNDINTFPNLQIVVADYVTDADSWFLLADKHDLNFYQREAKEVMDDYDFDGDAFKIQCRERFAVGFNDWRGAWGSSGS